MLDITIDLLEVKISLERILDELEASTKHDPLLEEYIHKALMNVETADRIFDKAMFR